MSPSLIWVQKVCSSIVSFSIAGIHWNFITWSRDNLLESNFMFPFMHSELTSTGDLWKITRYLRNQQVPTKFVLTYQLALPEMIFLFFLIINVVGQARRMLRQIYQAHITIVILYSHILCIMRIHSCNSSIDPFAISIQNTNLGEISRRCNLSMERDPDEETTQMPALSA